MLTTESLYRQWATGGRWDACGSLLNGRVGPHVRPLMAIGRFGEPWETVLHWGAFPEGVGETQLCFSVAIEDRDRKQLKLLDAATGETLGEVAVTCADPYQVLSVPLSDDALIKVQQHGLRLLLSQGERPLWLFAPDLTVKEGLENHTPRLLRGHFEFCERAFLNALGSMASIQAFSWKEGCVLDGLWELSQHSRFPRLAQVTRQHLDYFGFAQGKLSYETPRNIRVEDEIYGIEATLPFVHVARVEALHPWVDLAIKFWMDYVRRYGMVCDPNAITAEGAYTVAYPMAVVGGLRKNRELVVAAKQLLLETYRRLVRPDGIYLRHFADGSRTHRNWARGIAWLMLGHIQTLRSLPESDGKLTEQFQKLAERVEVQQRPDGLWACYTDEPKIAPDTAGSAGIAAALALGASAGFLPKRFTAIAQKSFQTLCGQVTSEGFLPGCAQSNKGGEDLQRSDYRVISPYALGLMGLLYAALHSGNEHGCETNTAL